MDIEQLKQHAKSVRALVLQQSPDPFGHSQSLDLIAALPGLRNWPEVVAFPDRVKACAVDAGSVGRLAFRLKSRLGIQVEPTNLIHLFGAETSHQDALSIWPTGPAAGLYITTEMSAIVACVDHWEEATDGGLFYSNHGGIDRESCINFGDGIFSAGMARVPSGTLFVLGSIELSERNWFEARTVLRQAAHNAYAYGHRFAVLIKTATPSSIPLDLSVLLESEPDDATPLAHELKGEISEDGQLMARADYLPSRVLAVAKPTKGSANAIPSNVREVLNEVFKTQKTGIMLVGNGLDSMRVAEKEAISVLVMTDSFGPAGRVIVKNVYDSPSEKDPLEPIRSLPIVTSIDVAIAQGYKRIYIDDLGVLPPETLAWAASRALIIMQTKATNTASAAFYAMSESNLDAEENGAPNAILGIYLMQLAGGNKVVDLFVRDPARPYSGRDLDDLWPYFEGQRVIRSDDQVRELVLSKRLSLSELENEALAKRSGRETEFARDLLGKLKK